MKQRVQHQVADGIELMRCLVQRHVDREKNVSVIIRLVRRLHKQKVEG